MKLRLPKLRLPKIKSRHRLKAYVLNLPGAMELACILSRKIDAKKISPSVDALDFISDLVQKLSPEEYLRCAVLLTRENEETIKKFASIEILTAFIEGLKENQVITLLDFYQSL